MPAVDVKEVQDKAAQEIAEDAFKLAVAREKNKMREQARHFTRKKVVFQWPIKFVDWYKLV